MAFRKLKNGFYIEVTSKLQAYQQNFDFFGWTRIRILGEHITDIYITETDTTELENLSHNIIDIFIIETYHN